jgi:GT2 family glycosyltransferase
MQALHLSICVVLYESVEVTKRFHQELIASLAGLDAYEILYFDNSQTDELQSWFAIKTSANVGYERDNRNLGFSYGNNCLILRARYERVLLLNPDIFGLSPNFWERLAKVQTQGTARFARLLNTDGSFQDCVGEPATLGRLFRARLNYAALTEPTEVGVGIFAFVLLDKQVIAQVGLLDCGYPLYSEDVDWCYRAKKAGMRILYDPRLELTHIGGASAQGRWNRAESLRKKYLAERIFIDKHFRGLAWAGMRALNQLKLVVKAR